METCFKTSEKLDNFFIELNSYVNYKVSTIINNLKCQKINKRINDIKKIIKRIKLKIAIIVVDRKL